MQLLAFFQSTETKPVGCPTGVGHNFPSSQSQCPDTTGGSEQLSVPPAARTGPSPGFERPGHVSHVAHLD